MGNVPATLSVTLGTSTVVRHLRAQRRPRLPGRDDRDGHQHGRRRDAERGRPSATNTGKLVNGTYALAQPLQIRAGSFAFAPLGGAAARRRWSTFNGPVSGANVPIELKQTIGETEGLRTGAYTKTLTFTLSTTTP